MRRRKLKEMSHLYKMTLRENYLSMVTPFKYPIKKIAKILGYTFITFGVVTFLLPTASPLWILGGFGLLGVTIKELHAKKRSVTYKLRKGIYLNEIKTKLLLLRSK